MYTLEKEIKKGMVFFKVVDPWTLKTKDFFYFGKENEMPIFEDYFFKTIKMLLESNRDKPYSRNEFNLWLSSTYNFEISETGRRLEIENSTLLFPLYKKLKFETYSEPLYFLSKKITKKGIERVKNAILNLRYSSLGEQEKELLKQTLTLLPKDTREEKVFSEFKKLICLEAERTAILNAKKHQAKRDEVAERIRVLEEELKEMGQNV